MAATSGRKRKAHLFSKENRPTGGRPLGSLNKVTRDARKFATNFLNDPVYLANFTEAWQNRKLAPQVEMMVWHYAYGKPKESIALEPNHQPMFMSLIQQLPPAEQAKLGEAFATLFRARLQAGDTVDVEAEEVDG